MRNKLYAILLFLVIASSEIVIAKEANKSKARQDSHHAANAKKINHLKEKLNKVDRLKRSLDDEEDRPFWANRGKKQALDSIPNNRYDDELDKLPKDIKNRENLNRDEPFWGTRGRRDSSIENSLEDETPEYSTANCKYCYGKVHKYYESGLKDRRDENEPFWGNRGRRSSDEDSSEPFWGNRGRRQDDEPFWGTRGRRKAWGGKGNGDEEVFWGSRGRRDDVEPFWGNRGRRQDPEPFWGNRGRRQENEPFWGNRGRRDEEPFWGNRGRRKNDDVWVNPSHTKEDLKDSILNAINYVENDIEYLSRLRRSEPFWSNRGRESKINHLFNGVRAKIIPDRIVNPFLNFNIKHTDPGTVTDSRIFAEEPHYIVVERSSRSSSEDDPFFISRGKKYFLKFNGKPARDRRGAIEQIVKSVRNDPYYIARGKKDFDGNVNMTEARSTEEFSKVKELICSAIDLIDVPKGTKVKREIDNDRDRRTILKKLAAQLQIDPYYVSRGKKNDDSNENLRKFITNVADKCV